MTDGSVEHAAPAIIFNPGDGKVGIGAVEFLRLADIFGLRHVEAQQHALLVPRIGAGNLINLLPEPKAFSAERRDDGIGRIVDLHRLGVDGLPRMAMKDAAEHLLRLGPGVKTVGGGMNADETFAGPHIGNQGAALGGVGKGEIGRVLEDDGVIAREVGRRKDRHVVAEIGCESPCAGAELAQRLIDIGDRGMHIAARVRPVEDKDGARFGGADPGAGRHRRGDGCGLGRSQRWKHVAGLGAQRR